MYKSKITYLLFTLTLVIILSWAHITQLPDAFTCQKTNVIRAKNDRYYVHPEKITVEPWYGEHNVYAIFMIPGGYINDWLFTVTIKGAGTYCGVLAFGGTTVAEGVVAKPGHYLMKALFPTRAALWLISQGKLDELKQPSQWTVGYGKINE
ncbi:MAG: hypothetical protein SAK29_36935 [Scytonema sp. PMC 1069.18]|nr:hypothetical protein [Scytonema sp. PMC 1069.18]MEC4888223.1 hypothetical protein [Scytonema sp. PMC 1070.18]